MKEIKFRAWNSDSESMIYSDCDQDGDGFFWIDEDGIHAGYVEVKQPDHLEPPEPTTVEIEDIMQFTGINDMDGREVYEGDILDCAIICKKVVRYNPEKAAFQYFPLNDNRDTYSSPLVKGDVDQCDKVIGNIHQNPELLKT